MRTIVYTACLTDARQPCQVRGAGRERPRHGPTMRDVAALAGVSIKTVSRVVNDEAGVSPDLVRRVKEAADQLDYRPNLAASSACVGRTAGRPPSG